LPRIVHAILPCAGSGSRLGLPFPKELAPLGPDRCLIDSSLDLICEASAASEVRVILMTGGQRDLTAAYVRGKLDGLPVAEVLQDPDARDMTDAVIALQPWLGDANVLLLPDVTYGWAGDPVTLLAEMVADCGFAVAAAQAEAAQIMRAGALAVRDDRVAAYEDKPADPSGYTAAWGMLGFTRGPAGMGGLRLVAESAARTRQGPVTEPPVGGAPVTWLHGWTDCGTWDAYRAEVAGR
jgi:dTDP-glucose pyrophosphorylase